jgi:hypothetical protein
MSTTDELHEFEKKLEIAIKSAFQKALHQDDEFEIIGCNEGEGKYQGCATWICKTKDGRIFNVTPKGSLSQKKKWFQEQDKHLGKLITVQFQGLSKEGIPEFGVGLGFRSKEDM